MALIAVIVLSGPGESRAQTDVVYTLANAALAPGGGTWSVDIQMAATTEGTRLGDALFYLDYDDSFFGTNVATGGRVQVTTLGPATPATRYAVHTNDNTGSRLAVALEYLDPATPAGGSVLTTTPATALRVTLDIVGPGPPAGGTPSIGFNPGLMAGQQYQSDPSQPYAQIRASASSQVTIAGAAPDWSVNPANFQSTVTLVGALTLGSGPSTDPNDILAAFVGNEVRGVANSIDVGGTRLFFLTIYADADGESVSFKAWDAAQAQIVTLAETIPFTANQSHGSVAGPFALTEAAGAQTLNLEAGWNLVSLTVTPADPAPTSVFADAAAELEFVTGFSGGATFFDPNGLPFLNTLSALNGGRGYWVKVSDNVTVTVEGTPLPDGFTLPLQAGWNLIGYWRNAVRGPFDLFASLIAANRLQFVTGFSGGATFFNPSGLSFLNTLASLQRGRGYWVRVSQADPAFTFDAAPAAVRTDGDPGNAGAGVTARSVDAAAAMVKTNRFMFVGGVLHVESFRKAEVLGRRELGRREIVIVSKSGRQVGAGHVLPSGHLAATAVYGDDPTTEVVDGALDGEELFLAFVPRADVDPARGTSRQLIPTGLRFQADMTLHEPQLILPAGSGASTENTLPESFALDPGYPNPFSTRMTLPVALPEAASVRAELFTALGRRVGTVARGEWPAGQHDILIDAARVGLRSGGGARLASGVYVLVVEARPSGGRPWRATQTIHIVR